MKNTLEMDILEALVNKANEIKQAYGFVPGFFGDPESVIDHIMEKRKKEKKQDSQRTLDKWVKFSHNVIDDLVSIFFSTKNVEDMVNDSFYGHNNINLEEIEQRMRLTEESIGNTQTLLQFLKGSVNLYSGELEEIDEDDQIYGISLPEPVQKDIGFEFEEKYLVTPNMEVSSAHHDIEGINLKNPVISGLIEKVKNEAFSVENEFYGRTAAFLSDEASKVVAIFNLKVRYVVNTIPKSLMEEITYLGLDLFSGNKINESLVSKIWNSEWKNHNKKDIELKKHLEKALKISDLDKLFKETADEQLKFIINERKEMIKNLESQGIATDLEGIDDIEIVGTDLLTVTIVYPPIGGT